MIKTYFSTLDEIGLRSNEIFPIVYDKNVRIKKGFLYDFHNSNNKEDYLAMYITEEGNKIFFPKSLRFPEYVDNINFGRHNNYQTASFSIQFPDSVETDEDVVFMKFPVKDIEVWLLMKDVDYTFPIDKCLYGYFNVQFKNALKLLEHTEKSKRNVNLYQNRLSLLLYPGSNSEKPMFRDYNVISSPKIKAIQTNKTINYRRDKSSDYYPDDYKNDKLPTPNFKKDMEIDFRRKSSDEPKQSEIPAKLQSSLSNLPTRVPIPKSSKQKPKQSNDKNKFAGLLDSD